MFCCATLILKCFIHYITFLKSFMKSECVLMPMICNCLTGNINFSEVHKHDAFCNDMLDWIGDVYTILNHWYLSLTNIWPHLEFSADVKPLVLGTEVGPEISNSDVRVSRLGEKNGWGESRRFRLHRQWQQGGEEFSDASCLGILRICQTSAQSRGNEWDRALRAAAREVEDEGPCVPDGDKAPEGEEDDDGSYNSSNVHWLSVLLTFISNTLLVLALLRYNWQIHCNTFKAYTVMIRLIVHIVKGFFSPSS